jgi:hypothetical protein
MCASMSDWIKIGNHHLKNSYPFRSKFWPYFSTVGVHPHIFCHFLRKEYSFIRMYIMFASNVTFLLNLKIRIYLQVISPSDTQPTKKSRSIPVWSTSIKDDSCFWMQVLNCLNSHFIKLPFLLASNCAFCFRCISLKQISNEISIEPSLAFGRTSDTLVSPSFYKTGAKPVKLKYSFFILFFSYANHIWHYEFF